MTIPRTPNVRETAGRGVPGKDDSADIVDAEHSEHSSAPKTSGAPERGREPLANKNADRKPEGPREAGATPRPTERPITGGQR